jgi:hypothetical protein
MSPQTTNLTGPYATHVQLWCRDVTNISDQSNLAGGRITRADKQDYKLYDTKTLTRPCLSSYINDFLKFCRLVNNQTQHKYL